MIFRKITATATLLAILGITTASSASFLSFGTKKGSTKQTTDSAEVQQLPSSSVKLRITAHFTNIFAELDPTPVIRRSVKAGEEFSLIDSSEGYWIILDGGAKGYISRPAAAILGTAADTVVTPVIDTISAKDIPAVPVTSAALDTTVKPAAAAIEAKNIDTTGEEVPTKQPINIPAIIALFIVALGVAGSYWTSIRRKALRRVKFRSAILVTSSFTGFSIDYGMHSGNHSFSLKQFLLRFGIALDKTRSLTKLPGLMAEIEPDVIIVDWRIAPDVVDLFRQLLGQYRLSNSITVIFCYVDLAGISQFKSDFGTTPIHVFSGVPSGQQLSLILKGEGKPYHRTVDSGDTGSYLAGQISGNSLEDVFQLIETGRKSGALEISDDEHFGYIYFKDGVIVHASTREHHVDTDALYEILRLKSGSFCFDIQKDSHKTTMEQSVMALLMEWSTHTDQIAEQTK